MMNCGYDPAPDGKYDLPPIAPQMWHAYHVAGEQLSMAILAALMFRFRTGKGQQVSCAIHEAVAKCTEVDLMTWVMRRSPVLRQTCRHAREAISPHPTIAHTKDGRWVMANLGNRPDDGRTPRRAARALRHRAGHRSEDGHGTAGGEICSGHGSRHVEARSGDGGGAAVREIVHVRERAVARGPTGRDAVGAA